jgi:hypothetical protein
MNRPLRLYFVGDEEGGEAVLAQNGRDAKKFAWPYLDSSEWITIRTQWIRDARLQHISDANMRAGYRLTGREGLKTGAFGPSPDDEGPECLRCGDTNCKGCAYRDHWLEAGQE